MPKEIGITTRSTHAQQIIFTIPLTTQLRGYKGSGKKYQAKSDFLRVTNVWSDTDPLPPEHADMGKVILDISELYACEREAQKPLPLLERLVLTHSGQGGLVVDPFVGWGTTGMADLFHGRRFKGCDADASVVLGANERCAEYLALGSSKQATV